MQIVHLLLTLWGVASSLAISLAARLPKKRYSCGVLNRRHPKGSEHGKGGQFAPSSVADNVHLPTGNVQLAKDDELLSVHDSLHDKESAAQHLSKLQAKILEGIEKIEQSPGTVSEDEMLDIRDELSVQMGTGVWMCERIFQEGYRRGEALEHLDTFFGNEKVRNLFVEDQSRQTEYSRFCLDATFGFALLGEYPKDVPMQHFPLGYFGYVEGLQIETAPPEDTPSTLMWVGTDKTHIRMCKLKIDDIRHELHNNYQDTNGRGRYHDDVLDKTLAAVEECCKLGKLGDKEAAVGEFAFFASDDKLIKKLRTKRSQQWKQMIPKMNEAFEPLWKILR